MPTTAPGITPADAEQRHGPAGRGASPITRRWRWSSAKSGRAETATDPRRSSMIETTIRLKPRDEWPRSITSAGTRAGRDRALKRLLGFALAREGTVGRPPSSSSGSTGRHASRGWTNAWTAPIRARLDMMSTGVRTPVGVRIVTDDPAPARRAGRGGARGGVERAGHEERGLRGPGRRNAAGVRRPTRQRSRGTRSTRRWSAPPRICSSAAGRFGQLRVPETPLDDAAAAAVADQRRPCRARARTARRHAAAASKSGGGATPLPPAQADWERRTAPAADRPPVPVRDLTRRALAPEAARTAAARRDRARRRGDGQPVPLALLGRPTFVSAPAQLRTERGARSATCT